MNSFTPKTLDEVLGVIADAAETCPESAMDAYDVLYNDDSLKIYTLTCISRNAEEPWAAQVAADWLKENGYV